MVGQLVREELVEAEAFVVGADLERLVLGTVGARVDSSAYWLRPVTRSFCVDGCRFTPEERTTVQSDDASRYRNNVYLAKAWVTYKAPGVEATVGDTYAQFGRGLVLSMRKVDELGVDVGIGFVLGQAKR